MGNIAKKIVESVPVKKEISNRISRYEKETITKAIGLLLGRIRAKG
jgi:hypothetical protein